MLPQVGHLTGCRAPAVMTTADALTGVLIVATGTEAAMLVVSLEPNRTDKARFRQRAAILRLT